MTVFHNEVTAQTHIDPWIFVAEVFVFLAFAWIIVGNRYLLEGDTMERPANRIAQLYGYTVCLIAVITFLVNVQSIAGALITLQNPLASPYGYGQSLDSFEAYKATYDQPTGGFVTEDRPLSGHATSRLSDAELRARYDALRVDRINSARFQATRDITLNGLMLVIAVILFVVHWRWLRTLSPA